MLIAEETISQVRDASDIVEVISEFVPNMKRAGKDYKALCPFHQEKTPSFMVSPSKGIFHCFGCGVGGDVFKFVMEIERCSYPEAIEKLADRKSIPIRKGPESPEHSQERERRSRLLEVLERTAQFYHKRLLEAEEAEEARHYLLEKRKLSLETIKKFRLGWAPGGGQVLLSNAVKNGFTEEDLLKAGLVHRSQKDGRVSDYFRKRVVFPIYDVKGRIIAFGGRILDTHKWYGDNPPPKYLNSPDTEIFHKGRNLYGFFHGAKAIRDDRQVVVVEGYMDVIGCHQAGLETAVAPLGTSLTQDQCQLLKRYVDQVTLLFDSDQAGDSAASRGSELLVDFGFLPMIARLPEGKDADEYLQKHSLEEFRAMLKDSLTIIEFKLETLWVKNQDAPDVMKKVLISQSVMPLVMKINDDIIRREMLKTISNRLKVKEESLDAELRKARESLSNKKKWISSPQSESSNVVDSKSIRYMVEGDILAMLTRHPELREAMSPAATTPGFFSDEKVAECWKLLAENITFKQPGDILNRLSEQTSRWLSRLLINSPDHDKPLEVIDKLLKRLESLMQEEKRKGMEPNFHEQVNRGTTNPEVMEYQQLAQTSKGIRKPS